MKLLRLFLWLFASGGAFYALSAFFAPLPPLGNFFNPFSGFWTNNRALDSLPKQLSLPQLEHPVDVVWDERQVPHIFAKTPHDLYFAQGYLTARHRLWQMEFQALAAVGRLSEVIGARAVEFDRFRRRIGMPDLAKIAAKNIVLHPDTRLAVSAYTDGVNAWIESLTAQTLPIEYKLLDYRPEEWSIEKTAALFASFSFDLTFRNSDAAFTKAEVLLSKEKLQAIYPIHPPYAEPIAPCALMRAVQPNAPTFDSLSLPIQSDSARALPHDTLRSTDNNRSSLEDDFFFGSNNWAVSGKYTVSGYPILCSDPHLSLNLPSIWYEVQLVCDSAGINVYGVSAPSLPGVIIGFNHEIAWGLTNAGSDVLDWYDVKFDERTRQTYRYGNETFPIERVVEEIKVRGRPSIIDTIYYTRFGPIPYLSTDSVFDARVPKGKALRWLATESNNELLTFLKLNRAKTYRDYLDALSHYNTPAQNFAFASKSGDIAIWHNGNFPIRKPYQGASILDATDPAALMPSRLARNDLPHLFNPERGFVSSANQQPSDSAYPYYLGWDYAAFERSARINEQLKEWIAKGKLSPEQMMSLQTDNVNLYARLILPTLLSALSSASLSTLEQKCLDELRRWNFEYRPDLIAPTIFEAFATELSHTIWDDDLPNALPRPMRNVTAAQITGSATVSFLDDTRTPVVETLSDLTVAAFRAAIDTLTQRYGDFGENWKWREIRKTTIQHLARLSAFSRMLPTSGNYNTVNATAERFGPSWRMVVQLGDTMKAWGIYPGGQSGNPGSPFYDNFISDWADGRYYPLHFLRSANDVGQGTLSKFVMLPGEGTGNFFMKAWEGLISAWWLWWLIAFIVALLLISRAWLGFVVGAVLVGGVWLGIALSLLGSTSDLIATKIAVLLQLPSPSLLVVATGILGFIIGGLGGATGSALRTLLLLKAPPAKASA
ncbi:MAG: penicillin acylase family protein [[Chlorobium] sp. 445]|nr:MAG: penicillin acylase family protein [[Chlorobium] sp. 445]